MVAWRHRRSIGGGRDGGRRGDEAEADASSVVTMIRSNPYPPAELEERMYTDFSPHLVSLEWSERLLSKRLVDVPHQLYTFSYIPSKRIGGFWNVTQVYRAAKRKNGRSRWSTVGEDRDAEFTWRPGTTPKLNDDQLRRLGILNYKMLMLMSERFSEILPTVKQAANFRKPRW